MCYEVDGGHPATASSSTLLWGQVDAEGQLQSREQLTARLLHKNVDFTANSSNNAGFNRKMYTLENTIRAKYLILHQSSLPYSQRPGPAA